MSEYIYQSHGEPLVNERGEIYLARAGEIVRCRDCKHYGCKWISKEVMPYFKACYRLHAIEFMVEPDGFCSWAERRTDDNASSNA